MIEVETDRHDSGRAASTVRRFAAGDAAICRRACNRAAGLRTQCSQAHPQGNRRTRATARSSGRTVKIPGVARHRGIEAGEFGRDRLSQNHGASRSQPVDDRSVSCSHVAGANREPASVGQPVTSKMSLIPIGMPCNGPRSLPAQVRVEQPSLLAHPCAVDQHPGVYAVLVAIDRSQARLDKLDRARAARANRSPASRIEDSEDVSMRCGQ